jgi:hypothetical protein
MYVCMYMCVGGCECMYVCICVWVGVGGVCIISQDHVGADHIPKRAPTQQERTQTDNVDPLALDWCGLAAIRYNANTERVRKRTINSPLTKRKQQTRAQGVKNMFCVQYQRRGGETTQHIDSYEKKHINNDAKNTKKKRNTTYPTHDPVHTDGLGNHASIHQHHRSDGQHRCCNTVALAWFSTPYKHRDYDERRCERWGEIAHANVCVRVLERMEVCA